MTPLLRCEIPRNLNVDRGVEIAGLIGMLHGWHAVALQSKDLTVMRARRDLQPQRLARKRLDLSFAAQDRGRQGHRDARIEVFPSQLEPGMWREVHAQVKVARLCPRCAVLTLAGDPDARALAHAGRDPDVHGPRAAVVRDREASGSAVQGVFEVQLDLLLDVASL